MTVMVMANVYGQRKEQIGNDKVSGSIADDTDIEMGLALRVGLGFAVQRASIIINTI